MFVMEEVTKVRRRSEEEEEEGKTNVSVLREHIWQFKVTTKSKTLMCPSLQGTVTSQTQLRVELPSFVFISTKLRVMLNLL